MLRGEVVIVEPLFDGSVVVAVVRKPGLDACVQGPTGRPHFALTAEHLFDLRGGIGASHEDLFAWRPDYSPRFNTNREESAGAELAHPIDAEFGECVDRTAPD